MFRYIFALCLLAVVAISVNAEVEEVSEVEKNSSIQRNFITSIIGKIAGGMLASCVIEAGEHCIAFWKNPSQVISCATDFFKENKGRCAVGK